MTKVETKRKGQIRRLDLTTYINMITVHWKGVNTNMKKKDNSLFSYKGFKIVPYMDGHKNTSIQYWYTEKQSFYTHFHHTRESIVDEFSLYVWVRKWERGWVHDFTHTPEPVGRNSYYSRYVRCDGLSFRILSL